MKTIVFFHRLELTDLYIDLAAELADRANIVHLAYSDTEYNRLVNMGLAEDVVHFKNEVRKIWSSTTDLNDEMLTAIDQAVIGQTNGAFTLNGLIQSDRGFVDLEYKECLKLALAYYIFWNQFVKDHSVDFILHETPSLLFNIMGVIVLGMHGGKYLYNVMVPTTPGNYDYLSFHGFDFTCSDIDDSIKKISAGDLVVDLEFCERYLDYFRKDLSVFLGSSISRNVNLLRLAAVSIRNTLRRVTNVKRYDKYIDNIDWWEQNRNMAWEKIVNTLGYKKSVKYDDFDANDDYYFYGFQLEPEAGVFYQGHGIYMNQVKLIQNIASQLPPKVILYVKDHPHDLGYREAIDYIRLNKVPNIKFVAPHIPAKQIMFSSRGVFTITGTAGFEAAMMGKNVYTFGKTFYSPCKNVTYIKNVRDIRNAVYSEGNKEYSDEECLYPFLTAFMHAKKEGLIDYYGGRAESYGVDLEQNKQKIGKDLLKKIYS